MVILMDEREVRKKLRLTGLRVTYPRLALLTELGRSHAQPKSAAELAATLSQFPRSTIYRSLEALEKTGLIRSSLIKWVRRYELGDNLSQHHHHITCIQCQKVNDFESSKLDKSLETAAEEAGYRLIGHAVELRGVCSDCRDDTPDPSAARAVLEYGIRSMKRLRPRDSLMEKLRAEDTYIPFDGEPPEPPRETS